MTVLALDIATKTGWALYGKDMELPHHDSVLLKTPNHDNGTAGNRLRKLILAKHQAFGLTEIIREAVHIPAPQRIRDPGTGKWTIKHKVSPEIVYRLIGLGFIVDCVADELGIPSWDVEKPTWRKEILGRGNLKTDDAKKRATDYCRQHGWHPADDNAAEALCILDYHLRLLSKTDRALPMPWRDDLFMRGVRT